MNHQNYRYHVFGISNRYHIVKKHANNQDYNSKYLDEELYCCHTLVIKVGFYI